MGASCDYKFHDVWKLKYLPFFFKVDEHFFFCFVFDSLQFTAVNLQLKDQTALCQCDTAQPSDTPSVPPEIPPLKFGTT